MAIKVMRKTPDTDWAWVSTYPDRSIKRAIEQCERLNKRAKEGNLVSRYRIVKDKDLKVKETRTRKRTIVGRVFFTTDPDEIVAIYRKGPHSCMKGSPEQARGYGDSPDLALAYMKGLNGRVTVRTICWPDRKIWYRMYGGEVGKGRMSAAMARLGYRQGSLSGARIVWHTGMYDHRIRYDYTKGVSSCGQYHPHKQDGYCIIA